MEREGERERIGLILCRANMHISHIHVSVYIHMYM